MNRTSTSAETHRETIETAIGHLKRTHKLQSKKSVNMSKKPVTQTADNGTGSSTAKDGFVSPTICVKLKHLFSQPTTTIEIKNRYDKLHNEQQNESDMDMETTENTEDLIRNKAIPTLNKKAGNTKPPPIVIKGKLHSHKLFLSEIKKVTKKEITLKYAKNSVILYTEDKMDHQTILRQLKEEQTEFHTYTTPEEEIKQELQDEHNMQVFHIYKMKNTVRPLYFIIADTKQTASKLNQEIRSIMSVRVSWEKPETHNTMPKMPDLAPFTTKLHA